MNPKDICECIIALLSLNINIKKIDHINKLAKKDIGRIWSGGVKASLMQEALVS